MARTFKIVSFDKYQHYKDRDPPWVKLYRDTLTSDTWLLGTDLSRLVQLAITMIAPRYSNTIPTNWTLLRKVLNLDCTEQEFNAALEHLEATNFIEIQGLAEQSKVLAQSASKPIATCTPDKEVEAENIVEERRGDIVAVAPDRGGDDLDLPTNLARGEEAEAAKIYNHVADRLRWGECQKLTGTRKAKLRARLRECGGLDGWKAALEKASSSKFLRGETKRGKGHENWRPDIDFFLTEAKFTQLMEGKYDDRTGEDPYAIEREVLAGLGLASGLDGVARAAE